MCKDLFKRVFAVRGELSFPVWPHTIGKNRAYPAPVAVERFSLQGATLNVGFVKTLTFR